MASKPAPEGLAYSMVLAVPHPPGRQGSATNAPPRGSAFLASAFGRPLTALWCGLRCPRRAAYGPGGRTWVGGKGRGRLGNARSILIDAGSPSSPLATTTAPPPVPDRHDTQNPTGSIASQLAPAPPPSALRRQFRRITGGRAVKGRPQAERGHGAKRSPAATLDGPRPKTHTAPTLDQASPRAGLRAPLGWHRTERGFGVSPRPEPTAARRRVSP